MVEIKNLIQFPTWKKFCDRGSGFFQELKAITYGIYSDDLQTIDAKCRWCYTSVENETTFPYTEQGYNNACKWIEEQRIKLIEELI